MELTSGEIKSRAGLDNIDVTKGHENFANMRIMVENFIGIIGGNDAAQTGTELKKEIDEAEVFHKVNFTRHLEHGLSK